MKNTTTQVLFIGNHSNKTVQEIPQGTLELYKTNRLVYNRGELIKHIPATIQFNETQCDFNGNYEIENLTIALDFFFQQTLNLNQETLLVGDPFELIFQASIYALLKENPTQIKESVVTPQSSQSFTVVLLYPATIEFENLRKEISQLIYTLKKHKINTLLIENHINQASALDNILYYLNEDGIKHIEHKIKGVKQILGHTALA
jgi:hypothetical protein